MLPKAAGAVAVLSDADVSWHRITLPKAPSSRFFEVRGRLRLSDRVLEQRSLVQRSYPVITVLSSERINSNDSGR